MILKKTLRAASGWLELGMPEDALSELSNIPESELGSMRVLELKMLAYMATKDWVSAGDCAALLCRKAADNPEFFLNAAFCSHEVGDTAEAKNWLQRGPDSLVEMPIYHYNMACYLWKLGEKERARNHLNKAAEMDADLAETAKEDSDLVGIDL